MGSYVQIHELPPRWMQASNGKKISNQIGKVHAKLIHKRTLVARKYLRVRVEISIDTLSRPVSFFSEVMMMDFGFTSNMKG